MNFSDVYKIAASISFVFLQWVMVRWGPFLFPLGIIYLVWLMLKISLLAI